MSDSKESFLYRIRGTDAHQSVPALWECTFHTSIYGNRCSLRAVVGWRNGQALCADHQKVVFGESDYFKRLEHAMKYL